MSKKLTRTMALLSAGGFTFFIGIGIPGCPLNGQLQNADLVNYYTDVGDNAIAITVDAATGNIGTDFERILAGPTTNFLQAIWGNYVATQYPADADGRLTVQYQAGIVEQ